MDASQIGKRAWDYAGVLRDAGLSCFEYVEQLTLLHGRTCLALREPAAATSFREELENVATTTRNLIALAHVLGAVSWQPQITFERKEIM